MLMIVTKRRRSPSASERAANRIGRFRPSPLKLFNAYRKSFVPADGWSYEELNTDNGRSLILDISNINRSARGRGILSLSDKLSSAIQDSVDRVIEGALGRYSNLYGVRSKQLNSETQLAAWESAIQDETGSDGLQTAIIMVPILQSVADDVYGKVSMALGVEPNRSYAHVMDRRVRGVGKYITSINETTRGIIRRTVLAGVSQGMSVGEVADKLRGKVPSISSNRVPTIARTEMGRVTDTATKVALVASGKISHVSVIGCRHIEKRSPHLDGMPTCNLRNIPINREGELNFHIGHSGLIVPSGMYKKDGTPPDLVMHQGGSYTR